MTANEKRQKVVNAYKPMLGRNYYSQDIEKRECALKPFRDGKYYSDCSSSIRKAYQAAAVGFNNIGGNTAGIHYNPNGVKIKATISNGIPTNESQLRPGDCFMFVGNDPNRPLQIGHIEMYVGNATLYGHGSGNPSAKRMEDYCRTRYNSVAGNGKRKGLIEVIRFIKDDEADSKEYKIKTDDVLVEVVGNAVNVRKGPGIGHEVACTLFQGAKLNVDRKIFVTAEDGHRQPWFRCSAGGWICAEYLRGWICEENGKWWYLQKGYSYPVNTGLTIKGKKFIFDEQGWHIGKERMQEDGSYI